LFVIIFVLSVHSSFFCRFSLLMIDQKNVFEQKDAFDENVDQKVALDQ
jgi:hypothetical protein